MFFFCQTGKIVTRCLQLHSVILPTFFLMLLGILFASLASILLQVIPNAGFICFAGCMSVHILCMYVDELCVSGLFRTVKTRKDCYAQCKEGRMLACLQRRQGGMAGHKWDRGIVAYKEDRGIVAYKEDRGIVAYKEDRKDRGNCWIQRRRGELLHTKKTERIREIVGYKEDGGNCWIQRRQGNFRYKEDSINETKAICWTQINTCENNERRRINRSTVHY